MTYPIVVIEGLEVSLFPSTREAEEYLQGVNVSSGVCVAFDAEGRALKLEATGGHKSPPPAEAHKVRIFPAESEPEHAEDLKRRLRDYLKACGERLAPDVTLPDLIRRCRSIHLYRE